MPTRYNNNIERAHGTLLTRWCDQKYYLVRLIYYNGHQTNPEFTEEDRKKKCEILEIPNTKTCFITKIKCKGTGDHLFEINGYAKYTDGLHGTYDEWNTIPVLGSKNKSYKTKYGINNKNIGFQELTQQELSTCSKEQQDIYNKLQQWKLYVKRRGASLSWKLTEKENIIFQKKKRQYNELWKNMIDELNSV
tara:strand:+ start:276 stop:851 length:576 start_codon:yes stop_codon:yes gene_type:complete